MTITGFKTNDILVDIGFIPLRVIAYIIETFHVVKCDNKLLHFNLNCLILSKILTNLEHYDSSICFQIHVCKGGLSLKKQTLKNKQ